VATTYQLLQSQKARVEYAKKQYERFADLYKNRSIEKRILDERQEALAAAKAKLAEIEAELAYALGKPRLSTDVELRLNRLDVIQLNERALQGALDVTVPRREALLVFDVSAEPGTAVVLERSKPQPGSVVDKLRQALDKEVTVNFKNNPLENVLFNWGREFDIQFVMGVAKNPPVSLRLDKPLPLGAALQAVEDFVPTVKFVVRDYGILVAPWDRVPSGAVPLNVFWKASAVKDKKVAPVDKKP
jgi:hypothetical protein